MNAFLFQGQHLAVGLAISRNVSNSSVPDVPSPAHLCDILRAGILLVLEQHNMGDWRLGRGKRPTLDVLAEVVTCEKEKNS